MAFELKSAAPLQGTPRIDHRRGQGYTHARTHTPGAGAGSDVCAVATAEICQEEAVPLLLDLRHPCDEVCVYAAGRDACGHLYVTPRDERIVDGDLSRLPNAEHIIDCVFRL